MGAAIVYTARMRLPASFTENDSRILSSGFEDMALALSVFRENGDERKGWILEWVVEGKPSYEAFAARLLSLCEMCGKSASLDPDDWAVEPVPERNWLEHSYSQFPPFSVGPFFIYGSHWEEGVPDGQMGLQIDAATAFGSGEHGTTKGCLQAMLSLKARGVCPWNVLDMGTGSGILAVAAWKLWHTPVLAVDNDPEAVRVADIHRAANDISSASSAMICVEGDGFNTDLVQKRKPFDLIIANILAGPLVDMAGTLAACVDENGYVVLSGLLCEQAERVLGAYELYGLKERERFDIGEWSTLVLQNTAS
ncbi:MAG: 50S ribosomal protein L11 methyltransferase [Alphaproteobacteria bacterium]|nr:50S ribosomal protein L11 methyltransferase [Alphaproteobacteria bacterium]